MTPEWHAMVSSEGCTAMVNLFGGGRDPYDPNLTILTGTRWRIGPLRFGRVWRIRFSDDDVFTTYLSERAAVRALFAYFMSRFVTE